MSRNQTVVDDERTPVEVPNTLASRFPVGAFVAFNGPIVEGTQTQRRAIVIDHEEETSTVVVLDGAERVPLTDDALDHIIVLGSSAEGYAQRVEAKARELSEDNGWCGVATTAIEQLHRSPLDGDTQTYYVVAKTTTYHEVQPNRYGRRELQNGRTLADLLRDDYAARYRFDSYFAESETPRQTTTLTLVDRLPTDGDGGNGS